MGKRKSKTTGRRNHIEMVQDIKDIKDIKSPINVDVVKWHYQDIKDTSEVPASPNQRHDQLTNDIKKLQEAKEALEHKQSAIQEEVNNAKEKLDKIHRLTSLSKDMSIRLQLKIIEDEPNIATLNEEEIKEIKSLQQFLSNEKDFIEKDKITIDQISNMVFVYIDTYLNDLPIKDFGIDIHWFLKEEGLSNVNNVSDYDKTKKQISIVNKQKAIQLDHAGDDQYKSLERQKNFFSSREEFQQAKNIFIHAELKEKVPFLENALTFLQSNNSKDKGQVAELSQALINFRAKRADTHPHEDQSTLNKLDDIYRKLINNKEPNEKVYKNLITDLDKTTKKLRTSLNKAEKHTNSLNEAGKKGHRPS